MPLLHSCEYSLFGHARCQQRAWHRWHREGVAMHLMQESQWEREFENTMRVQRRAAEEEWKVKSIPNAKTNASKLATATLMVMEWAWNAEFGLFWNTPNQWGSEAGYEYKVRRARMWLCEVEMWLCCWRLIPKSWK